MTSLFKKLNFKDQKSLHIIQAPDSFHPEMKAMGDVAKVITSLTGSEPVEFFSGLCYETK